MSNRALFLDRDGVINVDTAYTYRRADFVFIPGIFSLARAAVQRGYKIFIVTNQAGIGRGYYTEEDFWTLMDWVATRFREEGAGIEKTYFCPHHPEHALGDYLRECDCRKPAPGMLLKAAKEHDVDLERSIFIGDKKTDMVAGSAAGIGCLLYVGDESDFAPGIRIEVLSDAAAYL